MIRTAAIVLAFATTLGCIGPYLDDTPAAEATALTNLDREHESAYLAAQYGEVQP